MSSRNFAVLNLKTTDGSSQHWWPWFNMTDPSSVTISEYSEWYSHYSSMVGPEITDCSLEAEMNKVTLIFQRHVMTGIYTNLFHDELRSRKFPQENSLKH